jgi:hypothetical protein
MGSMGFTASAGVATASSGSGWSSSLAA